MFKAKDLYYFIDKRPLIQGIELDFAVGLIHAILGPNGAGKTTLLKILTGLWPLTLGAVYWNGEDLLIKPRHEISKVVTFVSQSHHIPFDFTVEQFVEMGSYLLRKKISGKQVVTAALEAVGVFGYQTRSINALSQGEKQRVLIARALVTEAPVLVLDEPTANLDIKHQKIVWNLLKTLAQQGKTIILSTHDLNMSQVYSDHIHVLQEGKCIATGAYASVMTPTFYQSIFE